MFQPCQDLDQSVRQGDVRTLEWSANADLSGADLTFLMALSPGAPAVFTIIPTVVAATSDATIVATDLTQEHTEDAADYYVVLKAVKGTQRMTFPTEGHMRLYVRPNLS